MATKLYREGAPLSIFMSDSLLLPWLEPLDLSGLSVFCSWLVIYIVGGEENDEPDYRGQAFGDAFERYV